MRREKRTLSRRLAECLDALGAQRLLDQTTLLHHGNLLQVRFELAVGCTQGERAIVTECGCLAAGIALGHLIDPFRTMIPMPVASSQRHGILPYNATIFKILLLA
jgi:hypothetical protein